ncbi:hypothetical protein SODALDRAFT_101791 [Sodiomyces alkalinus F11]|uniref:Uncharacterized protein n=1 Tax=Sodiomyces alkalinus (strain CBS 110278 / VKM F-3762 / F11) TaxID=1314773 RepID=A0A3N2Q1L3_SODAK|nr:hypothetical protein SODALDRAFT_101791 [Sodiomyces alkalinus F11]ROT40651.1 hypothetical protein SODALDRAFT_101791 [Sodiomyces alkalinus F11]
MVRDILQHQVNTAHDSSEALFYRLLGTHGFPHQSQNGDHSELEAYVAMASLLGLDPDDCVALASPSRPCRSIDMMGYLLLSRSINRWAEVCDASADEPLLAPGTNHMFTKADVLHQYVLQQPLYAGSLHLNQHTTVRGCATWCNQVLRNKLDSRSFFYLRDLRPLGGPAEQKGQAELTCLLWHALHTLSHTPRCTPPAWASTSEQDLGASAVELLSVVCRLVLRRPNPGMRSDNQGNGKGKEKEKASRVNLEMGIPPVGRGTGFLETALEGARALVRLEDKELWDVFLAEFLSMNEGSAAGYSSPTCISSPLDVDIVKDLQQVIATTAGITVPYQYLASSIALLPATTESSRREPEQGELYPEGLHFSALDRSFLRQDRNNMLEPYCGRDTDYGGLVVFGTGDSLRQQYRGFHQRYPLDILSVDASPIIDPSASQSFAHGNVFLGPGPGFDSAPSPHTQPLVLPYEALGGRITPSLNCPRWFSIPWFLLPADSRFQTRFPLL